MSRPCPLCAAQRTEPIRTFESPPPGETDFGLAPYRRELRRCPDCGVYFNVHGHDLSGLYVSDYNQAKYSGTLLASFRKVMALPPGASDNQGRVERVLAWLAAQSEAPAKAEVLDVGSGLAVFPAAMARRGLRCHCLDPSPLSAAHALEHADALSAAAGSIVDWPLDRPLDLITWNKVLEHVADPLDLLRQSALRLKPGGAIYVELPDGDTALAQGGPERQEFFIDHVTVWSLPALRRLARMAGLEARQCGALTEPSGKHTLFAFLR